MSIQTTSIAMFAASMLAATIAGADFETRDFTFETAAERTHAARLFLPADEDRNGHAVLLIGGGNVQDMHWTVPGAIETPEGRFQFTIDGTSTTDADTLANAIADAGFIVMQWSSIYEGDPLHEQNRAMATPMEYPDSVRLAADALAAMRAQPEINADRIILLGHSLGASGVIETVAAILALEGRFVPPTVHLESPDPLCDVDLVGPRARASSARTVLANAFGFGGNNASLLLRACA